MEDTHHSVLNSCLVLVAVILALICVLFIAGAALLLFVPQFTSL